MNTFDCHIPAKSQCHVVIIGCGLGGLAASIGIRRSGHSVTILERMAEIQEIGAGINITPNATRIFKEWGLLETIQEKANVPYAAFMRSYRNGMELSRQQLGPTIEHIYHAPYVVIHRGDLHTVLLKEARRLGVSIVLDSQITTMDFDKGKVGLSNGEQYSGDIIIGADGEKSACRAALLGSGIPSYDSGDHVFRITVNVSDVAKLEDIAELVQPPCINLWVGPDSHAMTYALKRDDLMNIVLTCGHDRSNVIQQGPQRATIEEVRNTLTDWDKKFHTLLGLAQGCSKWTLLETPIPQSWTHSSGKFVLLGDSAHAMLPFLGQGAAMAFEDAAVLSTLFSKLQHKSQLPDILSIFERLRRPRITMLHSKSRAMRDLLAFCDGPHQQERDRQLRLNTPFEGYPNFLADPVFQPLLFGYNAVREAENAWSIYLRGEWPSTKGKWNASEWNDE